MSAKVSAVVSLSKQALLENKCVVIGLQSTGKPRIENAVLKYVKVYMGDGWHLDFKQTHFDAYSPPDFYTRVGISGAPTDEIMRKTKSKEDTWRPVWNEEFTFELTLLEIALLRIEVHEYDMSEKHFSLSRGFLGILISGKITEFPEQRPGENH